MSDPRDPQLEHRPLAPEDEELASAFDRFGPSIALPEERDPKEISRVGEAIRAKGRRR
jgi:hypothetical protein